MVLDKYHIVNSFSKLSIFPAVNKLKEIKSIRLN